eukprot:gene14459-19405_t
MNLILGEVKYIVALWACLLILGDEYNYKSSCDIHTNGNYGHKLTSSTLPSEIGSEDMSWLFPSLVDIKKYYEHGISECKKHLSNHSFTHKYAEIYSDSATMKITGQNLCRGAETLYALTGAIIYPFGPISTCPTYSNCWFGLLTCSLNNSINTDYLYNISFPTIKYWIHEKFYLKNINIPKIQNWSIKCLPIHMRLIGPEIVIPDQRYLNLKLPNGLKDDIIIAQYHLTKPSPKNTNTKLNSYKYHLEMRHLEMYPSILYNWPKILIENNSVELLANIFLGGNEGRCRAWSKCDSMSRDLLSAVSRFLGVMSTNEDNLKKMTNVNKMRDISIARDGLILSEAYGWDWSMDTIKLASREPLPQVLIVNYALSHRSDFIHKFKEDVMKEFDYWSNEHIKFAPLPKYRIYQTTPDMHGRRTHYSS